jgi:hypothetical protein
MELEINGKTVEVDASFAKLSPEDQQKTVNEIAASMGQMPATEPDPSLMPGAQTYIGQTLAKPVAAGTGAVLADVANVGKILYNNVTPNTVGEVLSRPLHYAGEGVKAFFGGLPGANMTMKQAVPAIGRGLAGAALAPENAFTLPYNMAAYEQEKIRANPNAPGLEFNPYAQTVRGEIGSQAPSTLVARQQVGTQNMAGAANQMRTVANMPYGNVNAQERAILEQDRMMRENIRKKAYQRVMGPVAPGSF